MTRTDLIRYYQRVRRVTEDICRPLETEDLVTQPVLDVSPPKWHLGHTTWFYEAMFLDKYVDDYQPYDPQYAFVFNSYYDTFGTRVNRDSRGSLSRPTVAEIMTFRAAIDQRMGELIEALDEKSYLPFSKTLILALNHEQQHQELLLTDIKYILASNPLRPAYREDLPQHGRKSPLPETAFLPFAGGVHEIGYQGEGFYYDNERPLHKQYLNDFRLANRLVSNGEYLEFIEAGGYGDFRFWLSDGWAAVQENHWHGPLHWEQIDGQWYEYTLGGLEKVDAHKPVCHVSYYEADAFAAWKGKRLPTEGEWEVAARHSAPADDTANFYDRGLLHPAPLVETAAADQLHQMMGDVWEWTRSAYLPYPGYRRVEGPLGEYNGKFMINQMTLRGGGSCATSRDHARITYRNFFQADKRWQFKGFRLAEDA